MTSPPSNCFSFPGVSNPQQRQQQLQQQQQVATTRNVSSTRNTSANDGSRQSNVMNVIKVPVIPDRCTPAGEAAARMVVRTYSYLAHRLVSSTDVTSGDFVAQLCRATSSRDKIASVTWRVAQLFTVAQLFFRIKQCSILCNLVAKMLYTLIGRFFYATKVAVCDMHSCTLQLCRSIKLRDKVA